MVIDLREVLLEFWLSAMKSENAEYAERIKASELLAKYFLGGGSGATSSMGGKLRRPPTSEILSAVDRLERRDGRSKD